MKLRLHPKHCIIQKPLGLVRTSNKMPSIEGKPQTLYDKVLQAHIVDQRLDGTILLYIDRHLVHEVTSPVSVWNLCGRNSSY